MARLFTVFFMALLSVTSLFSQIVVNQTDMPSPGDTVRLSVAMGMGSLDPAATGPAYTWDYSSLSPLSQQVDSFVSVSATPFLFQLVFNNPTDPNRATLAQLMSTFDVIPGFSLSGVYSFFRSTASQYSFVGYAGEFNGIPIPAKFSSPDILYKFPMQYGHSDSSIAILDFGFPGIGSIYIDRFRRNFVDGYGTLITPYGTHDVLKLRSEVVEYDSVFLDTLGQGIALNRFYTEYKWIGIGFDLPLLQITQEGALQTIAYIDSVRITNPGISDYPEKNLNMKLWPNPSLHEVQLAFTMTQAGSAMLSIYNMMGSLVLEQNLGRYSPGEHQVILDDSLLPPTPGHLLIRLTLPEGTASSVLMRL